MQISRRVGFGVMLLAFAGFGCEDPSAVHLVLSSGDSATSSSGSATVQAVHDFKPGLAVRGMSCLACHANIQGGVITDFGYGDSFYMDENLAAQFHSEVTPAAMEVEAFYDAFTWQTMDRISGQVVVPDAQVPADVVKNSIVGANSSMGLVDYLNSPNATIGVPWNNTYWGLPPAPATMAFSSSIQPASGLAPILGMSYVYIGAPTVDQIRALSIARAVPGISSVTGVKGQPYFTNTGTVQCAGGDAVIDGTLLFDHLQIEAGNGGCRLYVTGSVFIEGPITYLNETDPTENLQISSAKAIIMGVGLTGTVYGGGSHTGLKDQILSQEPLKDRLITDPRYPFFRSAPTSAAYSTWANGVLAEGENIGATHLRDASDLSDAEETGVAASGQIRESIDFHHLVLNAPSIHSRYLGTFNGVIISEVALFALGEFRFLYDDVFSSPQVPVLPAIPDVLCVGETAAPNCNPVSAPSPVPSASPTASPSPSAPFGGGFIGT